MLEKIKEKLGRSKYFGWVVQRKELWVFKRHNVALGAAIGVAAGLAIPIAQIPLSAILSVFFRAHIGIAAVSTLVTNPLTFAPIYYLAYRFGEYFTGIKFVPFSESESFIAWLSGVGAPLAVGLGVFSIVGFFLTYALVYSLFGGFSKIFHNGTVNH